MKAAHAALGAVALAAVVAVGWGLGSFEAAQPAGAGTGPAAAPSNAPSPAREARAAGAAASALAAPTAASAPAPLGSGEPPNLRADAAGHLTVDAHTRDELERLLALNGRAESLALLRSLESVLPPVAYREAVDAYYAFQNYLTSLAQAYPAGQPVADENEALAQLEGLHALRVATLGPQVAAAYFGDEEATARRLIAYMQAHPMPGATLEEKALRAQEALAGKP